MSATPETHLLKIQKKVQEAEDAFSFYFEIPTPLSTKFMYRPGQFVTLILKVDGEEIRRSYSLCTSPLVDKDFGITVKRVAGGRGSNFLIDHVNEGSALSVVAPAGIFFRPPTDLDPRHYFLFAAGSGITPMMSILKSALALEEHKVTLVFANRTQEHIIFHDQLNALLEKYPDRLRVIHILSQPAPTWSGLSGRCRPEILDEVWNSTNHASVPSKEFYVCGPDGFMKAVEDYLVSRGVDKSSIRKESFNTYQDPNEKLQAASASSEKVIIGVAPPSIPAAQLRVKLDGQEVELEASSDQSILESLLAAGYNPPYSCMDGACMACMAKVQEGTVYQADPGILTEDNIKDGETLTCQARPAALNVRINYDDL